MKKLLAAALCLMLVLTALTAPATAEEIPAETPAPGSEADATPVDAPAEAEEAQPDPELPDAETPPDESPEEVPTEALEETPIDGAAPAEEEAPPEEVPAEGEAPDEEATPIAEEEALAAEEETPVEEALEEDAGELIAESPGQSVIPGGAKDNDALFAAYIEDLFYSTGARGARKVVGNRFTGSQKAVYDYMLARIQQIAAGDETSTIISIPVSVLGVQTSWTREELGASTGEEAIDAAFAVMVGWYNLKSLIAALLADCPYDLYWYDKTSSTSASGYSLHYSGNSYWVTGEFTVSMPVADDYAAYLYETDPSKVQRATQSAANARAIVARYAGCSDLDRLAAYKDEICDLASYNYDAVNNNAAYGDPWQMIDVFDGDSGTRVVCEGYSKAFQYLCDQTGFNSGRVCCYTVTGNLISSGGSGAHMWNIVTLSDGNNYLVDVTNCDSGTSGEPDYLFLKKPARRTSDGAYYFATGGGELGYAYDDSRMRLIYDEDDLTLNDADYRPIPEVLSVSASAGSVRRGAPVTFTVETGLGANYISMYAESGALVKTWDASCASAGADRLLWTVAYAINTAGNRRLTFRCSADGETYDDGQTVAVTVTATPPAVASASASPSTVEAKKPVTFTVKTPKEAKYLALFAENGAKVKVWGKSAASTVSGSVRVWTVTYSIANKGSRKLTFKCSANGTYGEGKTVALTVTAPLPAVASASASVSSVAAKTPVTFTVVTPTEAKYLALFAESGAKVKVWGKSVASAERDGVRVWTVTYSIANRGDRKLTFKCSANGTYGEGKTVALTVK